jgi:hypothetical protein
MHFSVDNAKRVPQYLESGPLRVGKLGPRKKTFKEAHDGDKEKGCQEKKEKVTLLRSQVSVKHQGKIVVTGVQSEHPFLLV